MSNSAAFSTTGIRRYDELSYWVTVGAVRHLVIPYSFETNDNRFDQNHGFSTGDEFARYMIDCFETMYEEGAEHPKLMSLALHDRLTGRPGRITGLVRFLDHIAARDRVWICTGREIAEHWPAGASGLMRVPAFHEIEQPRTCCGRPPERQ